MLPHTEFSRWEILERNAHRLDVQEQIRREIRLGTIRVRPTPDGGIRIIPLHEPPARSKATPNFPAGALSRVAEGG